MPGYYHMSCGQAGVGVIFEAGWALGIAASSAHASSWPAPRPQREAPEEQPHDHEQRRAGHRYNSVTLTWATYIAGVCP